MILALLMSLLYLGLCAGVGLGILAVAAMLEAPDHLRGRVPRDGVALTDNRLRPTPLENARRNTGEEKTW